MAIDEEVLVGANWLHRLTAIYAVGLMLQGGVTLAFRMIPALDRALPSILATTQMIEPHSLLHIASALLALAIYRGGDTRREWQFLLGFGLFYTALGLAGHFSGQQFGLGLQAFDHPFHLVIGGVALVSALAYGWRGGAA